MIDARSKRALPEWYKSTAIQHIRPTQIDVLDSQHYWRKWERIEQKQLDEIAERFFQKLTKLESPSSDCFMFDTTNYYTYMASNTKSDLAKRGKNKAGKNWLRQIGVALLVSRDNRIPFYYREYEGNRHDSKLFARVMDHVIGAMHKYVGKQGNLTIVFDKGMNSEDNIKAIDIQEDIHFITTYSSYFAKDLVQIKLKKFQPGGQQVSIGGKNERLS
jgi:transposase